MEASLSAVAKRVITHSRFSVLALHSSHVGCGASLINRVKAPSCGGSSAVCSSVEVYSVNLHHFDFLGPEYIIFVTGIRTFVITG